MVLKIHEIIQMTLNNTKTCWLRGLSPELVVLGLHVPLPPLQVRQVRVHVLRVALALHHQVPHPLLRGHPLKLNKSLVIDT